MKKDNTITVIEPSRGWFHIDWSEFWKYRELFVFMVWRDIAVKYKQTLFGISWALIGPLLSTVVFTLIFGNLAKLPSDGLPAPLFYMAGLVVWRYFSTALTKCSTSLVGNQALLTKIYVPRLIIPISSCINQIVDFMIGLAMLVILMLWFGKWPSAYSALIPVVLLLSLITALGWGLLFGALNVRFRDVGQILPLLLQLWMYVTVIFPFSRLPDRWGDWRYLYGLNPMVGAVEGMRWCMMAPYMNETKDVSKTIDFAQVPGYVEAGRRVTMKFVDGEAVWKVVEQVASPVGPPWILLGVGALSAVLMLIIGLGYFKKVESQFADIV
ncbi:ABC transporter permease [Candidatus Sumerlaeota bacterium]|nr:ABC transporter permease [Candidatus Sumerlaeota bacterium]